MIVEIHHEALELSPTGALYWPAKKALFIADAHIGKVMHFRKNGIALPTEVRFSFYEKIAQLLTQFEVATLYFLGDLFHSDHNSEWADFCKWTNQQPFKKVLIEGNHDILPKTRFEQAGLEVYTTLDLAPFYLSHHPIEATAPKINLCGHLHPGVRLKGLGGQYLKAPCFYKKPHQLILPAFGGFTGMYLIKPTAEDQVYVLGESAVIAVNKMKK